MTDGRRHDRVTRRLLACMSLVSATLVGCLLHPGGRAAPYDGGTDGATDGRNVDGSPPPVCAGAGVPIDPLTTSPCGSGSSTGSGFGGTSLVSEGGTLTASVTMGMVGCTWNVDDGPAFQGVVVHVTSATAAPTMGQAFLTLSDGGDHEIGFQYGSDGQLMADGYWGTSPVGATVSVPFCARIHIVQDGGSAGGSGVFVEGEVDDGSGWQPLTTDDWFASGSAQVTIGVGGMGAMASFDHLSYVAP